MLVYRMPVPNEWVYSLKEVSLSKRSYEINEQLKTRYQHRKNAGLPCNWPPKDDPHCTLHFGWAIPGSKPLPNPFRGEHFYAHQMGVAFQQAPLINNCLAYVYNDYAKRHQEAGKAEWERVPGEFSFRKHRMEPEEFLFQKIRRALSQLLPELRGNKVYDQPIFNEDAEWSDIIKSFAFYLPWMAKWCLHSYTMYPEDWTDARGEYREVSIFKKESPSVPAFTFDTMSPAIMAAMEKGPEKEEKPKKVRPKKVKETQEYHWLDNDEHNFDLRHGDE